MARTKRDEEAKANLDFDNAVIYELRAENFQKLRIVTIRPDGRPVVMLTGGNGSGKTSVLDAIWFVLKGTEAFSKTGRERSSAVRNGAETARVSLTLRDGKNLTVTATRTIGRTGNQPILTIQGKSKDISPQDFADAILNNLTFDPSEFIRMSATDQIEELKKLSHVTLDFAALDKASDEDYKERTLVGREIDLLKGQLGGLGQVLNLPTKKIDVDALIEKQKRAEEENEKGQQLAAEKQRLGIAAAQLGVDRTKKQGEIELIESEIKKLQASLKIRQQELKTIETSHASAEKAFRSAPEGERVSIAELTAEIRRAQDTNAAIDKRETYDRLDAQIRDKQRVYDRLTNQRAAREEKKKEAIAQAKIPIDGLTFDQTIVRYRGMPLGNLSGGEQLRLSARIGMAANPKLHVMCIRNSSELDENGIKAISELATEYKFQVWMSKPDTSGKVGIVMEDGMDTIDNDKETK